MASAQDWYARKLGGQQYQPPRIREGGIPKEVLPYQQHDYDYSQQRQHVDQPSDTPPPPGSINVHNFVEMAGRWRGGIAHRTDTTPCPECGSTLFFSRVGGTRMGAPAPHCFSCGYAGGLFTQGDPATWGAAS